MKLLPALFLASILVSPVFADVPADQAERARLLRELLEDAPPVPTKPAGSELPGAKLDIDVQANRQKLQMQQFGDSQWRRMLGEQQAGKIRQEMTGIPSVSAPARAMGFERDQRMRDLSMRLQQQDQQIRLNNQR
ncbi:MAG TPA: hypothetical protein VF460_13320 [Burkholderiales bacterium]